MVKCWILHCKNPHFFGKKCSSSPIHKVTSWTLTSSLCPDTVPCVVGYFHGWAFLPLVVVHFPFTSAGKDLHQRGEMGMDKRSTEISVVPVLLLNGSHATHWRDVYPKILKDSSWMNENSYLWIKVIKAEYFCRRKMCLCRENPRKPIYLAGYHGI